MHPIDLSDARTSCGLSLFTVDSKVAFVDEIDQFVKMIDGSVSEKASEFVAKAKDDALAEWERFEFYNRAYRSYSALRLMQSAQPSDRHAALSTQSNAERLLLQDPTTTEDLAFLGTEAFRRPPSRQPRSLSERNPDSGQNVRPRSRSRTIRSIAKASLRFQRGLPDDFDPISRIVHHRILVSGVGLQQFDILPSGMPYDEIFVEFCPEERMQKPHFFAPAKDRVTIDYDCGRQSYFRAQSGYFERGAPGDRVDHAQTSSRVEHTHRKAKRPYGVFERLSSVDHGERNGWAAARFQARQLVGPFQSLPSVGAARRARHRQIR